MKRNLIVHCYPRRSGKWRRTLAHLAAGNRWSQFTGRKIVTIAHDRCCSDPDEVAAEWPAECEIIIRPNVPALQEVAAFVPMLERVESRDPDECTTYVHCKGATQKDGHASHLWCDGMAAMLDYPEIVEDCFQHGANIAGAFRSHGLWREAGHHGWHFAGTWFSFKHDRAFGSLNWRNVIQRFEGVEAWPGNFRLEESACLFYDNSNTGHLYDQEFWRTNIIPSMHYWLRNVAKCGLKPLCNNPPNTEAIREGLAACRA